MPTADTDPVLLQERILRLRLLAYSVVAAASVLIAIAPGLTERPAALGVLAAAALLPHVLRKPERRLVGALLTDAVVGLGLWWIYGPVVGVDFILFYVVAAGGVLLPRRQALTVAGAALVSELAQVPLHFLAEVVVLPVFHPVVQVQSLGEFLGGIGLRAGFLVAAAGLFITIGSMLRSSLRARRESEQRYRELYEEAPYAYFSVDPAGRIILANHKATELLGVGADRLVGGHVLDLYAPTPAGRDRARLLFERFREGGEIRGEELEMETAGGERIWVRLTVGVVRDPNGWVVSSRSALEDITAEREAEAARSEAEERFRSAFERAPIGMVLVDRGGSVVRVNRALVDLLGHPEVDLLGTPFRSLAHPDDREVGRNQLEEVLAGAREGYELEERYLRADGSVVWGRTSASPVRDGSGEVGYLVAQIVDLTAHREAQERLEELVRSKDEFVASVSHELRTPLTAVVGFTEVLEADDGAFSGEERRELLRDIARSAHEVAAIVEDLLVAARADIGMVAIVPEPVDLCDQAEAVLRTLGDEEAGGVTIRGERARAWGDPVRIRQILRNLLINALRYGGDRIEAVAGSVSLEPSRVRLVVRDDGPGVPESEAEAIFAPYRRAHNAPGQPASVGVGLAVSRELARLMGGDLVYECREGWSTFELTLPVPPAGPGVAAVTAAPDPVEAGRPPGRMDA